MYTVHTIPFQCQRCTLPQQLRMYTLTQSHSVHHSLMIIYNKLQLLACPCTNSFITCVYIQLLSTHTYCMYIYTYILQYFLLPSPASKRRNPDHHSRLTFEDITRELATDPEALLSWSQQDKATSSKASVLGAPLEEGKHLYPDLQNKYT